jgi:hypothetical protein
MAEPRKTRVSAGDPSAAARAKPTRKPRARSLKSADVAERAYYLSLGQPWASPEENWLRAEQELLAS